MFSFRHTYLIDGACSNQRCFMDLFPSCGQWCLMYKLSAVEFDKEKNIQKME